jgi:hypothetical protein
MIASEREYNFFYHCFLVTFFLRGFLCGATVVEVTLRGWLNARSAIPNRVKGQPPLLLKQAHCILSFLLFFSATRTKAKSRNVIMSRV